MSPQPALCPAAALPHPGTNLSPKGAWAVGLCLCIWQDLQFRTCSSDKRICRSLDRHV